MVTIMKTIIINKKISGFTLLELMITIAIIAILVTLATPSSFFQQTAAVNYADTALQQAKIFSNYISDNYSNFYSQANSTPGVPVRIIVPNSYWGGVSGSDIFGDLACATVSYNSQSQKLNMYMYYNNAGSNIRQNIISAANNYLSGIGGKLDAGGTNYVGAFNTWSVSASSIQTSTSPCNSGSGLAINLNSLITQTSNMQADNSLHRFNDPNNVGTVTNYNTMQTDIIMGYVPTGSSTTTYNGIFFDGTANPATSPYLTSGNNANLVAPYKTNVETDIVAANANLVANAFLPIGTATINSACAISDLGKIMKNSAIPTPPTAPTGNIPLSDLVCSYNTLLCSTPNSTCYLSISDTASRMRTNAAGNAVTFSSLTSCPSGSVIDKSIEPVLGSLVASPNDSTNCRYTEIGPRVFNYTATSVTVTTTWLLVYTNLTSGVCNTTNTGISVGSTTLSGGNYAPAITAAACTQ